MIRSHYPFGDPPTYPMGLRKTRNLELAQARGEELRDTCPLHSYPIPEEAVWEYSHTRNEWTVTFYPCEHRGYPEWPTTSRFLHDAIARTPRPAWWQRLAKVRHGQGA
jgi:hypothetical protein